MNRKYQYLAALVLPAAMVTMVACSTNTAGPVPARPEGPCDIYAAGGAPCVAAHSTTRALYASYNGPLYQVMRMSDGKTLDIGVVQPSAGDPGGYADAAAQDKFCEGTYGFITILYDQSGYGNHLVQAPRGGTGAPTAMGGFNTLPIADMAPVTLMGHKVYGIFIESGMGLRLNDAKGTAVDDQAQGQYWVINGHHYNDGCCFDYGNAEIDSRDDGDGTMESTYYGNASFWYHGAGDGPWIMTDQENNLVGGVNPSPTDKYLPNLPSIDWRFVTATADGEPHHWRMMGGDAQDGALQVMYDGGRIINPQNSYDPMRKQGAILLGNGGDNSNASQGTFYEAAMTAAGTFPSDETCQKVQANIVAAGYDLPRVSIAPASAVDTPPGLQTFAPKSSEETTITFVNTTGKEVSDLALSIVAPKGWTSVPVSAQDFGAIAPGATVSATFNVTSGSKTMNGDLKGKASWTVNGKAQSDIAIEKVRNVDPITINEFRMSSNTSQTDTFIELYNAGDSTVDISNWSLTQHATQMPIFSSMKVPAGTQLGAKDFYVFGLSTSGLAVPAKKGESTVYLRSSAGLSTGDEIEIGTGSNKEIRKIASVVTPVQPETPQGGRRQFGGRGFRGAGSTTLWQPLPEGPVITIPKGSTSIPVASVNGFQVGQKMAIGYGATYPVIGTAIEKYEVVTITEVGKPGTQAWLSMDAKAGDTNIKVSDVRNITVGDKIRLDIDSVGHGIEWVTVKRVGTASSRNTFAGPLTDRDNPGTGLELEEPLKFDHASNLPFSNWGTGISFEPASKFAHSSNEPVLPLILAVELDKPLSQSHEIEDVVLCAKVATAGFQGTPDQWFGGPALNGRSGSMVLRDAADHMVDSLNYGALVDPWAAEGYQTVAGARQNGCFTTPPSANNSTGRFPDGTDNDDNNADFKQQQASALALASDAGSNNIKIGNTVRFRVGQKIYVDTGANSETAVIKTIGTTGGTAATAAVTTGDTVIPVANADGFREGQSITIGSGAAQETAVVASVTRPRWGRRGGNNNGQVTSITVTEPLKKQHDTGEQVAGTGITFAAPLAMAHEGGSRISNSLPTPGAPNQF